MRKHLALIIAVMTISLLCEFSPGLAEYWLHTIRAGFGIEDNVSVESMAVFDWKLYAGVTNEREGASVWEYDGRAWRETRGKGFGSADNVSVESMVVLNGMLLAGTRNETVGVSAWRFSSSPRPSESTPAQKP